MSRYKLIGGMATCKGRERCIPEAVASIENQLDELHVYDNTKNPDIGDAGKFEAYAHAYNEDAIYFSLDDDLIYPPDYVETMLKWLEHFDFSKVVTCHGRTLANYPARNYYKDPTSERVHCLKHSHGAFVQIGGTGCMAFHTRIFGRQFPEFERKDAADIAIGGHLSKMHVGVYAIPHEEGWINHSSKLDLSETIFYKANRLEITDYYNRMME